MASVSTTAHAGQGITQEERRVILASSVGTVFEWYDFYLYATLAPFFAALFFPPGNDTAALLSAFATYAAGFLIRPFGAIIFGRIGDLVGRKYTFLVTIFVMGLATFAVGLLPTFSTQTLPIIGQVAGIGWTAPVLLVTLRLLQGLALGGEYGGAATYVAEHSQPGERGYATSWIQTTATLGFFLALFVIGGCRFFLFDAKAFAEWGWRIPFLVSLFLLIFSVYIRLKLNELPIWAKMKEEGKGSRRPLIDSFFTRPNNKYVLLALFGATAGQGVVWYTGQFYALFFLTITLKVDLLLAYTMVGLSLLIGTPFFVLFGWLSDKIGRLKIILAGCLIAAITYIPLFQLLSDSVNPDLVAFQEQNKVTLTTDTTQCNFHIFVGPWSNFTHCDRAKDFLTKAGLSFETVHKAGANNELQVGPIKVERLRRAAMECRARGVEISDQGGSQQDRLVQDDDDPDHLPDLRDDGLRSDRSVPGRVVPDQDSLHLHVAALPHRQRLVRRHVAPAGNGHRGVDRQHLRRALLPDWRGSHDRSHRLLLPRRHQGHGPCTEFGS